MNERREALGRSSPGWSRAEGTCASASVVERIELRDAGDRTGLHPDPEPCDPQSLIVTYTNKVQFSSDCTTMSAVGHKNVIWHMGLGAEGGAVRGAKCHNNTMHRIYVI